MFEIDFEMTKNNFVRFKLQKKKKVFNHSKLISMV